MKALVYEAPKVLSLRDVEIPKLGEGEVLLRTRSVGICGSDVHGYLGLTGRRIPPMIMGHEVVGEVVELVPVPGQDVPETIQPGKLAAVNPLIFCRRCYFCKRGDTNVCVDRSNLGVLSTQGAMSDYFIAPIGNLVPLPEVSPYVGALAEPLAVGTHAVGVLKRLVGTNLPAGSKVAVIGAGIIGLSVLAALFDGSGLELVVCDNRQDRLERISSLLPEVTVVNNTGMDWMNIKEKYAPEGFDAVIEVVGRSATMQGSIELVRIGGSIVWVGNLEPSATIPIQQVVTREIKIAGSYGFTMDEFRRSVERLPEQPWLEGLVDRVLSLEEGPGAFEELASGNTPVLKMVIDPNL